VSLTINKGAQNSIVVTLTEKTTLDPVYYLFEFIDTTGTNKYCIVAEQSGFLERFNEFAITETTNPDNENGEVELMVGDYVYNVYEQSSTLNLDPSGLTLVETGNAKCVDDSINTNKIYTSGSLVNKVYNG
jgi:hypothetical protein